MHYLHMDVGVLEYFQPAADQYDSVHACAEVCVCRFSRCTTNQAARQPGGRSRDPHPRITQRSENRTSRQTGSTGICSVTEQTDKHTLLRSPQCGSTAHAQVLGRPGEGQSQTCDASRVYAYVLTCAREPAVNPLNPRPSELVPAVHASKYIHT